MVKMHGYKTLKFRKKIGIEYSALYEENKSNHCNVYKDTKTLVSEILYTNIEHKL
jgi:hypothetical protein